jgi:hypothetical protein
MSETQPYDESTQPHPRHRRDGVPFDGAPDLGVFASSRLDTNSGPMPVHTLADDPAADLDVSAFGENPDVERAG